jgi:RNA polymerase sigma-70 factor (ECF subfamily)
VQDVERVFREEWGHAVAILTRVLGDLELAEDAVQDAFATALERWPRDGLPRTPGAWIVTTARNRAIGSGATRCSSRRQSSSDGYRSFRPTRTT